MKDELLDTTPADEADAITREPRESLDDKPYFPEKDTQDSPQDDGDVSTHDVPNNADSGEPEEGGEAQEDSYISGYKLLVVWVPLSLVAFLMLLDISIVATVNLLIEPRMRRHMI